MLPWAPSRVGIWTDLELIIKITVALDLWHATVLIVQCMYAFNFTFPEHSGYFTFIKLASPSPDWAALVNQLSQTCTTCLHTNAWFLSLASSDSARVPQSSSKQTWIQQIASCSSPLFILQRWARNILPLGVFLKDALDFSVCLLPCQP